MANKTIEPDLDKFCGILKIALRLADKAKKKKSPDGEHDRYKEKYPRDDLIPCTRFYEPDMCI
jgi:hypothetical protein